MNSTLRPAVTAALLLAAATAALAGGADSIAIRYGMTITKEDISRHLHVLASDEYEGRETGKEGQKKAAAYIAGQFRQYGIPYLKDSTYFQVFPLVMQRPSGSTIAIAGKAYAFMKDFFYFPGFADGRIGADEVFFLGYGIKDGEYDDYGDLDVKGKAVLVFAGEPVDKDGNSRITGAAKKSSWTTNWRKKGRTAADAGAACLLIVTDSVAKNIELFRHFIEQPALRLDLPGGEENDQMRQRIPQFYISAEMADALLAAGKVKGGAAALKEKIGKKGRPASTLLKASVTVDIRREEQRITSENVLAYIEGTDKKDEIIVVTAHYDHIGMDGDEVYNGADDDASGTTAVMEMAEAFARARQAGHGPRRSILFMPVSGEEKGLLGSRYYSENPVFPLANTVANLNIDMIGRMDTIYKDDPDYVYIIGSDRLSADLHRINEEANATYTNLRLDYRYNTPDDPNRFYYRSDHYNFARHNIPIIFYFNGTHEDYHKPTDTVDKIHFGKIEKIARLVFYTCWELANREERIRVNGAQKDHQE